MSLPKTDKPTFSEVIPSTKQEILFRPFLVKEEKILLLAQQSGSDKDITRSLKQVLNNIILTEGVKVEDFYLFDLEYLFLKARSKSVNNIVEVSYVDYEDNKEYTFKVDLDEVVMLENGDVNKNIEIDENVGIIMKFPTADILENLPEEADENQLVDYLIINCIDQIYDGDSVFSPKECELEELTEFIDNLDIKTYQKIKEFFAKIPKMYYRINYVNSLGNDRYVELRNLKDFLALA